MVGVVTARRDGREDANKTRGILHESDRTSRGGHGCRISGAYGCPSPLSAGFLTTPSTYREETSQSRDPAAEELDVLLTPIRARLLRALDGEYSMHALTGLLVCSRATATHHCDQLVKAGLLWRRRVGKTILVSRTTRGERLLEAYSR